MSGALYAPFPYFGGKRTVAPEIWRRLGFPKHYIEPFCGSAAILLTAPRPASLEVIGDTNGFVANFWRSVKHQPDQVALHADYPVSHVDLGARHQWLCGQIESVEVGLQDANWPGDAKVAGWWLWGQCCWIGSGWCVSRSGNGVREAATIPGRQPHISDAGMGIQAAGQVPHISDAGMGELWTSSGRVAWKWLHELADRLERVRIVHGSWDRCLNHHYGGANTAVFLDPPYKAYEALYGRTNATPVADECAAWARENGDIRIALCGHIGDYDLPGWTEYPWSRGNQTYGGAQTTDKECIWFSPACIKPENQLTIFDVESNDAD